jgi:hypothetical protein
MWNRWARLSPFVHRPVHTEEEPMTRSKSRRSRAVWGAVFFAYFLLVLAPAAHAYLDPGSGSFFFQLLIAGLVGGAVTVRAFWGRIRGFFSRRGAKKETSPPAEAGADGGDS